jgi:hypothetical protein
MTLLTLPFKFQVPIKIDICFVVENSCNLRAYIEYLLEMINFAYLSNKARLTVSWIGSNIVTRFCCAKVPYYNSHLTISPSLMAHRLTRKRSIAICLALSWKLLIYALETLFVASVNTPIPCQYTEAIER